MQSNSKFDRELAVVMPVYNEEACVNQVIEDWARALVALTIDFEILVINDGSRDRTAEQLKKWEGDSRIRVIHKTNEGHGPTIIRGYRLAAGAAEWVFHVDSDNEMSPAAFSDFWTQRRDYDFLFGVRIGRSQTMGRRLISCCSRCVVGMLAGGAVLDVNIPYRLMRNDLLGRMLPLIPDTTFAPNVAIAGLAAIGRARIANLPVPCRLRQTGSGSLIRWKMWKAAFRSLMQVGLILFRHRGFRCVS